MPIFLDWYLFENKVSFWLNPTQWILWLGSYGTELESFLKDGVQMEECKYNPNYAFSSARVEVLHPYS